MVKGITVLITGSHGRIGEMFLRQAPNKFHIVATAREEKPLLPALCSAYAPLNITDRKMVKQVVHAAHPRFIIHTAAVANVDTCEDEREMCWRVNVEGTEHVISAAKKIGAKIIHISTDFVFDGTKKGIYIEDDRPNPINYYGKSKLAAENLIRAGAEDYAIIRTASVVQPLSVKGTSNFALRTIDKLRAGEKMRVPSDEIRNPAYAANLCRAVWKLIHLDRSGVFNMSGSEAVSRYDYCRKIAAKFGLNEANLEPLPSGQFPTRAARPLNTVLDVTKAARELCFEFFNVEESIAALYDDVTGINA